MIFLSNLLFHHFTVHNLSHKVDSMANFPHPRLTISKLNFCLRACQLMIFYSFERPHNESKVFLKSHLKKWYFTPVRTLSISGLKSRVLKFSFLSLNMMVKSGPEFILKFTEPLQRYLLSCQANSATFYHPF